MTIKVQVSDDFPAAPLNMTQTVTAAGTTTILAGTQLVVFNKSVQSDSPCQLPAGSNGMEIRFYDNTGLAGDISAIPNGTDKIMGVNASRVVGSSGGSAGTGATATLTYYSSVLGWVVQS